MKNRAFDHRHYTDWRRPEELIPYEKNAKIHDEHQIRNLVTSLKRFGWQQDCVITSDNVLVIGHGRQMAAMRIGCEIPVHVIDKKAEDLTDEDIRELRIADNQTNAETGFDFELLAQDLDGLDFDGFDFDFNMPEQEEEVEIVEVEAPEPPEEPKSKVGDIYQIGNHRLICGDATDVNVINALMDGKKADLVVTDPPYNMAYEGAGNTRDRESKRIMNDNMPENEFEQFLQDVYTSYYIAMDDGASIYVFYKELGSGVFMRKMRDAGLTYKQELIWVKSQIVLGGSKYQSMYEPCLMGCKGKITRWNGGRKQRSVIEDIDLMGEEELRDAVKQMLAERDDLDVIREKKQTVNDLHPTMKPIRLLAKLITNSSRKGDAVMDLFGGSGSTLIACEQLGRKCYMAELDPRYCDVIIERWESFTGGKAVLLNG